MQLIVLGMHRSGTSGVTRILNMAGAWFGPEGIATDANEQNPKGFWERRDVRELCDDLLRGAGAEWWKISGFSVDEIPADVLDAHRARFSKILLHLDAHRPWVVKEPRLSLLLPVVRPLLEVPVCVHVVREPLEVAASVGAHHGFSRPGALALWEAYTRHAFAASAGLPRLVVDYDDLVRDPVATVHALVEHLEGLGVQGLHVPTDREITAFITPDLHRHRRRVEERAGNLNEEQLRLAAMLDDGSILDTVDLAELSDGAREALRTLEEDEERRTRLAELEAQVTELAARVERTIVDLDTSREQLGAVRGDLAAAAEVRTELREKLGAMRAQLADEQRRGRELDRSVRAEARARRALASTSEQHLRTLERQLGSLARSRVLRATWRARSLRLPLSRRGQRERSPNPAQRAVKEVRRALREVERRAGDDPEGPPAPAERAASSASATATVRHRRSVPGRRKVAVIAWDVGHNPVGRAHVLAGILGRRFEVEIHGAQFERYGSELWGPLQGTDVPVRAFPGRSFPEHLDRMREAARHIDADAVYVSKPRLPSLALGVLAQQQRARPLVLDVDDHELAFFDETEAIDAAEVLRRVGDDDLTLPFGRTWTQFCEPFVGAADGVTVSNAALGERFDGLIVPHARDERLFDPARHDRDATRRRLGIDASTRLLLFGGTPRVHKGVLEVLRALDRLGDERNRLLLFGARELASMRAEIGDLDRWVIALPSPRFVDLPALVGAADLACVLQDPAHPVSRYQLPAKVTDALAMQVPCLVNPTPPLASLIDQGALLTTHPDVALHERIAEILDAPDDAAERARLGRKAFEESYSYAAVTEVLAPMFDALLDAPPTPSPRLAEVVDVPRQVFGGRSSRTGRPDVRTRRPAQPGDEYDVVVFWKANDSGIYGRRHDMFVEYLARSPRVRSVVQFDSATTPEHLLRLYRRGDQHADHSRLIVGQTVRRVLRRGDTGNIHRYTYLYGGDRTSRLGLPPRREYPAFVEKALARHGIGDRPTIFWVYPTNNDVPRILDTLAPDLTVADVVDNNLSYTEPDSPRYAPFVRNYRDVLSRSDVVLANCEPVAEAMQQFASEVHVVPNACELRGDTPGPRPEELSGISGPIVGYAGNLSQRLDLELIEHLVRSHRSWHFVFIGSAHYDRSILALESEPNVRFLGVKPYEEARRLIQHFDVGLIPHRDEPMTQSMNPLKAFVYCSVGVPVVSTPIANLDELSGLVAIAHGHEEFSRAIESALRAGRRPPDLDRLRPYSWEARVAHCFELIDRAVARPAR